MKIKGLIFLVFALIYSMNLSAQILKGSSTLFFEQKAHMDAFSPNLPYGAELAFVLEDSTLYRWSRDLSEWAAYLSNKVYVIATAADTTTISDPRENDVAYVDSTLMFLRDTAAWLLFSGGTPLPDSLVYQSELEATIDTIVSGSGTSGYLALWNAARRLTDSPVSVSGNVVTVEGSGAALKLNPTTAPANAEGVIYANDAANRLRYMDGVEDNTLAYLTDIVAPALTATYVGYGDVSNELTGESVFNYIAASNQLNAPYAAHSEGLKVGGTVKQSLGLLHVDAAGNYTTGSQILVGQQGGADISAQSGYQDPAVMIRADYMVSNGFTVLGLNTSLTDVYGKGTDNRIGLLSSSGLSSYNEQANTVGVVGYSEASGTGSGISLANPGVHIGVMGKANINPNFTIFSGAGSTMYLTGGFFSSDYNNINQVFAQSTGDSLYTIGVDVSIPEVVEAGDLSSGTDANWHVYQAGIRVNVPDSDLAWSDKVYGIHVMSGKTLMEDTLQVTTLPNLASPTYNIVADANGVLHITTPSHATLKETTSQALASTATYTHIGSLDTTGVGKNITRTDSTITVHTAGTYRITYNFSVEIAAAGGGTWLVQFQPYTNAATIPEALGTVQVVTGGAETWRQVVSGETIMDLSASDVISLRYTATAGPTYTLYPGTITLEKL